LATPRLPGRRGGAILDRVCLRNRLLRPGQRRREPTLAEHGNRAAARRGVPIAVDLPDHAGWTPVLRDNPIRRYSIGDRTPGLRRNAAGSLDLWAEKYTPSPISIR
jgi:hypothetical protein